MINILIYLISIALNGGEVDQHNLKDVDFNQMYKVSKFHNLSAMVYMVLEDCHHIPIEIQKQWEEDKNKSIRKIMLLDAERSILCNFMEKSDIWHIPLKGCIIKDIYPKIGMREMADNDILYDPIYQDTMKKFMVSRDYSAIVGKGVHDAYYKPPIYNIELHTSLFGIGAPKEIVNYYKNIKDKLIKDDDSQYAYHFTDEDFYVYLVAHAFKHYNNGGMGIRYLVDCFVYLREKTKLDWHYIEIQLEKTALTTFENQCRVLSKKLFETPRITMELSEKEQTMLSYFYGAGTYGTIENYMHNEMKKIQGNKGNITNATKMQYYFRRIFPKYEWFKSSHPFLYKNKYFIPIFCVYRLGKNIILKSKKIKKEIRIINRMI